MEHRGDPLLYPWVGVPAGWVASNAYVMAGVSLNRPAPAAADHIAGMRTGWITRQPGPYPGYFAPPGLQAPDLGTLARQILS